MQLIHQESLGRIDDSELEIMVVVFVVGIGYKRGETILNLWNLFGGDELAIIKRIY